MFNDEQNDEDAGSFNLRLMKLRSDFNDYPMWNPTRVEAFKKAVEMQIKLLVIGSSIEFKIDRDEDNNQALFITAITSEKKKLTTSLPVGMILSLKCPKNLHELIATEFSNQLH